MEGRPEVISLILLLQNGARALQYHRVHFQKCDFSLCRKVGQFMTCAPQA